MRNRRQVHQKNGLVKANLKNNMVYVLRQSKKGKTDTEEWISKVKMILVGVTQTDIKCRKPVSCNGFLGFLITEKVFKN